MHEKLILIILVFATNIYTQSTPTDYNVNILQTGFTFGLLNGRGVSGLSNDVSNITFINPAAINEFKRYSFGLSYQVESNKTWFADIEISRITNFTPQSVGVVIPVKNLRVGIGMGQIYNAFLDLGEILITPTINPDGTGETYNTIFETTVQRYSLLLSYSFENLVIDKSNFIIGFKINLNRLHENGSLSIYNISESIYENSWAIGSVYKINYAENKSIQFGLAFESNVLFNKSIMIEVNLPDTILNPLPGVYEIVYPNNLVGKIPSKLMFDTDISLSHKLKALGNISSIFWNGISDEYKVQMEFSGSVIYLFSNILSASIGFYYTDGNAKDDFVSDKLNALFLTAGIEFQYDVLVASLAIADSHLLSGDFQKQTIGKMLLGVRF